MSVGKVSGQGKAQGIYMPTKEQLVSTYRSIVEQAQKAGTTQALSKAPANAEKYAHYDITPKHLMGSHSEVYVIKGELYLKQTAVVPHAKAHWSKVGPAPMF